MKKLILIALSVTFVQSVAQADCRVESTCGFSSLTLAATTMGPVFTVAAPFIATSQALKNDIVMIQGEAIMALETGIVSTELQSVIERVRIEANSEEIRRASDMEIVELLAENGY